MYRYDEFDRQFVLQRTAQFRDQVERRLAGELTEDEFKPLRLKNGLYLQLHAYMLRIAIPYGTLSSRQLRKLADIAEQVRPRLRPLHHAAEPPVQLAEAAATCRTSWTSWPRSRCTPSRPPATASATSPPTISPAPPPTRSPTRGPGPSCCASGRPLHPEFSYLPRKFKIAVTGAPARPGGGRGSHDIGLMLQAERRRRARLRGAGRRRPRPHADDRQDRARVPAGGRAAAYCEAILRVYNRFGRRDNKYKARVKILVHELGLPSSCARSRPSTRPATMPRASRSRPTSSRRIQAYFAPPAFESLPDRDPLHDQRLASVAGLRALGAQQHGAPQGRRATPSSPSR